MTVWHITKSLSGGAGQYALRLSQSLRDAGIDSIVLTPECVGAKGNLVLEPKRGVLHFISRIWRYAIRKISDQPFHSFLGFESYHPPLNTLKADIVHLHGMTQWIGKFGLKKLITRGSIVVQTTHSPWDVSGGCVLAAGTGCDSYQTKCTGCPALRSPWKSVARFELIAKRRFVQKFKVYPIANGEWMAGLIQKSYLYRDSKIQIIKPIVEEKYFSDSIKAIRSELGIPKHSRVISVGARSITDLNKGIQEFLEEFAHRFQITSKWTLLIFGEGALPYTPSSNIRLLGPVSAPDCLAEIYKASDVYVSPSRIETFGMTLLEAQAVGTAVIAFESGGIPSAIYPQDRHNLVALGDWNSMFARLESVLSEGSSIATKQDRQTWVQDNFSPQAIGREQLEYYKALSEGAK